MADPVSLGLAVALVKLGLRAAGWNDTADAMEDAKAGLMAWRGVKSSGARDPLAVALAGQLDQKLPQVHPQERNELKKVIGNVTAVVTAFSDIDIKAAAVYPDAFPQYVLMGPGRALLAMTGERESEFTREVLRVAAQTFAEVAPHSSRFAGPALVELLAAAAQQATATSQVRKDLADIHEALAEQLTGLARAVDRLPGRVADELERRSPRDKGDAVVASAAATEQATPVGRPVGQWTPAELGVHAAIEVGGAAGLVPYIPRAHDRDIADAVAEVVASGRPGMIVVKGTSCAGKSRALFEAVTRDPVVGNWRLVVPDAVGPAGLVSLLAGGVPAGAVVWLDELQRWLPRTPEGIKAAQMLLALSTKGESLGSILVAGTVWPAYLSAMSETLTPDEVNTGADAIITLLHQARQVHAAEVFTDAELAAANITDPRLRVAVTTATRSVRPEHGHKITQVLAGGSQLVNQMTRSVDQGGFSDAAKAILHAAGDLRRVGMDNPLPKWAIHGAAPGYLDPPDLDTHTPWFPTGWDEVTRAARADDPVTNTRTHDNHSHGIPALIPNWANGPNGQPVEAYDLHDYLHQDHQNRHRYTPTRQQLWDTLSAGPLPHDTAVDVARAAENRGLITMAITLFTHAANTSHGRRQALAIEGLARLGVATALRALAETGNQYALDELILLLGKERDVAGLRAIAETGNQYALDELILLLGKERDVAGLRAIAETGNQSAQYRLVSELFQMDDATGLRAIAETGDQAAQVYLARLLADIGDVEGLQARAKTGDQAARHRLIRLLFERGDAEGLQARVDAEDLVAQNWLTDLLASRGDVDAAQTQKRAKAIADADADGRRAWSVELLAEWECEISAWQSRWRRKPSTHRERIDLLERIYAAEPLRELAEAGDLYAQRALVRLFASQGDVVGLQRLVHGGMGASTLIRTYQAGPEYAGRVVRELDVDASPVLERDQVHMWGNVSEN